MTVAIAVDAVGEDVFGEHLHHADLTGPGTGRPGRVEIAFFEEFQRGEDLGSEQFGATAIMGQRDKRVHGVEIALHRAKVSLERPEGQQNPAGHPELALYPVEDRIPFLCVSLAGLNAVLADEPARKVDEGHLENAL